MGAYEDRELEARARYSFCCVIAVIFKLPATMLPLRLAKQRCLRIKRCVKLVL